MCVFGFGLQASYLYLYPVTQQDNLSSSRSSTVIASACSNVGWGMAPSYVLSVYSSVIRPKLLENLPQCSRFSMGRAVGICQLMLYHLPGLRD